MVNEKILIVEDDPAIQGFVKLYLEREGYQLVFVTAGEDALKSVATQRPDLILLDINLSGSIDGFEFLKHFPFKRRVPIIIITARNDDTDRVLGLELGADDYIMKPFNPRELIARIRAISRRIKYAADLANDPEKIIIGDIILDCGTLKFHVGENFCDLTVTEYSLLKLLMKNHGIVLSREQIMDHVWGKEFSAESRLVDIHIRNLRKKISSIVQMREYIQSTRGIGYKFER